MDRTQKDRPFDESAEAYARAWATRSLELEQLRLRQLRAMTETDSARRFAEWLAPPAGVPLRQSSGLVEQQRIFARLRMR